MGHLIRDCWRCGTSKVQMQLKGVTTRDSLNYEMFMVCNSCGHSSIYQGQPQGDFSDDRNLENGCSIGNAPVQINPEIPRLSNDIPVRTSDLFMQAATCLRYGLSEPAGAMFRKTIDVGTKELYSNDKRLKNKRPANALRSRLKALGDMKILDFDIVELADIAAIDGNDASHDEDPYTIQEAEVLETLTIDLLDRLFVRPAMIVRVREKQISSGLRKSDATSEGGGV